MQTVVRVVPSSVTRECNALSPFKRGVRERAKAKLSLHTRLQRSFSSTPLLTLYLLAFLK